MSVSGKQPLRLASRWAIIDPVGVVPPSIIKKAKKSIACIHLGWRSTNDDR